MIKVDNQTALKAAKMKRPKKCTLTFYCETNLAESLRKHAKEKEVKFSPILEDLLRQYLSKLK